MPFNPATYAINCYKPTDREKRDLLVGLKVRQLSTKPRAITRLESEIRSSRQGVIVI